MAHARQQHPNAVLTPTGRRRMVVCVVEHGWTIEAAAERFQVDAKTVRKWRDRFLHEGVDGLHDRSSPPRFAPNQTPSAMQRRVVALRRRHRWGAAHIGHELGLAASTVQAILRRGGLARLDRGDRATATEPPRRYQRSRPGELAHVDVKKLSFSDATRTHTKLVEGACIFLNRPGFAGGAGCAPRGVGCRRIPDRLETVGVLASTARRSRRSEAKTRFGTAGAPAPSPAASTRQS